MGSVEVYANEALTTLAATTTTSATSLTVSSSTSFPTLTGTNFFMARIEPATPDGTREFVKVTAVSGVTWTVVRAQEGSSGVAWASGASVSGIVTAGTLQRLMQSINSEISLTDLLNQKVASVHIIDDGSASGSWPNRLEFLYTPVGGGTEKLTCYFNEYGEIRAISAKSTTVPIRMFTKNAPGDPAHTVNMLELMDDRTTRTLLMAIDSLGNLTVPNLPGRITAASTAPSSPNSGDVWIDLSS